MTLDHEPGLLYDEVFAHVASLIEGGALRAGDRLPSVRRFARERKVSIATVLAAYRKLETSDLVEVRPKSGHFVRRRLESALPVRATRKPARPALAPARVAVAEGVAGLVASMRDPSVVPLGAASLAAELYPIRTLNRMLAGIVRDMGTAGAAYEVSPGLLTLRRQLARRSLAWGTALGENDFVITAGAMEAIHLALRATTKAGDSVVLATPSYFGILHLLEEMGLRVIEVPSLPGTGMDLDALSHVLKRARIRAVIVIPSFDNPSGALMPHDARVRLIELLERHDLPLIEDDIYGDLAWDGSRPSPVKALDRTGRVLLCGSISKTIAAGYRVGWIVPGRHQDRIERLKFSQSVATSTLEQMAVAEYLEHGGYDRHLRTLRPKLEQQVKAFREAIASSFPSGTRVSDPRGGFLLWVELPRRVDAMRLQAQASKHGIAIAPGPIFSARQKFTHCIRINCGFPWSRTMAEAVKTLGVLASDMAG
jgi:DNA-binding transcriptional MocR family regulator